MTVQGDINWNEVTISLAFYSNSFDHQVLFLNLLVEENLHPKVVRTRGREKRGGVREKSDKRGGIGRGGESILIYNLFRLDGSILRNTKQSMALWTK